MATHQTTRHSHNFLDLTGRRFGMLLVLAYLGRLGKGRFTYWLCRCDCGTEKAIRSAHLMHGKVISCTCLGKEIRRKAKTKHGMAGTREFRIWQHMIRRCYDKKASAYKTHGAKGIRVCKEWRESFAAWFAHVGPAPSPLHTLDRYPDQKGDYEPGNVRWATMAEQNRNKSSNNLIELDGVTKCLQDWANETGLKPATILIRLQNGWTTREAITLPKGSVRAKVSTATTD